MTKGARARLLLLVCAALSAAAVCAPAAGAAEGSVRFVKRATPEFDRFTNAPSAAQQAWMRDRFWRMEVFTPYFDARTTWFADGWFYSDLYSIYPDSAVAREHPEWILRDGAGNRLYIPWGCSNGTCPQYAADITNPEYRRWWIDNVLRGLARGYRGVWVDDVNLELRVGDGTGREVAPLDPATGQGMTATRWREAMAQFVEQLDAEVPAGKEILHNSIWYAVWGARDADPSVRRQIAAADYVNVERGINDGGLTGGTGEWSLHALLGYVDRVHQMGKGVILDAFDQTAAGREYNLAGYLLVSSGRDGVGEIHASPEDWWAGWDLDLGAATAARTGWNGLLRRDFAGGMVLLNEPGSPARTVALPRPMRTVTGDEVSTVTLGASRAAVLRELPAAPAGEEEVAVTVPPSSAVTVPPIESQPVAPAPVVAPEPVASPAPAGKPAPSRPARKPRPRGTAAAAASRRVAAPRLTRGRRGLRVSGRVRGASRGHVRVVLHRRGAGRWARVRTRTLVVRAGRFSHRFEDLRSGRYRVRAVYLSR